MNGQIRRPSLLLLVGWRFRLELVKLYRRSRIGGKQGVVWPSCAASSSLRRWQFTWWWAVARIMRTAARARRARPRLTMMQRIMVNALMAVAIIQIMGRRTAKVPSVPSCLQAVQSVVPSFSRSQYPSQRCSRTCLLRPVSAPSNPRCPRAGSCCRFVSILPIKSC